MVYDFDFEARVAIRTDENGKTTTTKDLTPAPNVVPETDACMVAKFYDGDWVELKVLTYGDWLQLKSNEKVAESRKSRKQLLVIHNAPKMVRDQRSMLTFGGG